MEYRTLSSIGMAWSLSAAILRINDKHHDHKTKQPEQSSTSTTPWYYLLKKIHPVTKAITPAPFTSQTASEG